MLNFDGRNLLYSLITKFKFVCLIILQRGFQGFVGYRRKSSNSQIVIPFSLPHAVLRSGSFTLLLIVE